MAPVIVKISMDIKFASLSAAGLSCIGISPQPPRPQWMAWSAPVASSCPTRGGTLPGLAIFKAVLAFHRFGDSVPASNNQRGHR